MGTHRFEFSCHAWRNEAAQVGAAENLHKK